MIRNTKSAHSGSALISVGAASRRRIGVGSIATYTLLTVAAFIISFPFIWMISTSLKPDLRSVFVIPPQIIPDPPTWGNYRTAWESAPFLRYTFNSVFVAVTATVLQVITGSLAAYAFARLHFRGKNLLFIAVLAVMMVPVSVTLVPLYGLMNQLKWLDSYQALIIPFAANALGIFLIRQAFLGIPNDLIDAARVDGANHWQVLRKIMLPLSKPSLITFALLTFKWRWNDYLWVLIMTSSDERRTLPVGIVAMKSAETGTNWPILMAGVVIILLPLLLLFVFAQRYFVQGVVRTGMKG